MNSTLDLDTVGLLVVFVLPGLVSMQVYRLLMPAKELSWTDALLQGFFYSSINFALLFPLAYFYATAGEANIWRVWAGVFFFVFIGPSAWPWLLTKFFRSKWVAKHIKIPYPSTWDYFFDDSPSVFLLVHLNNGDVIGGLWSEQSHAGQYPHDGDLYLEELYGINSDGTFGDPIPYSKGLLIRKGEYTHIEIFDVPAEEDNNG